MEHVLVISICALLGTFLSYFLLWAGTKMTFWVVKYYRKDNLHRIFRKEIKEMQSWPRLV